MAFKELKAIDVMSLATVSAIIAAIWGLVSGIFTALGLSMFSAIPGMEAVPMAGFGFATVLIAPIVAAIIGFVGGAISAFIYNIVAEKFGGVKLDI